MTVPTQGNLVRRGAAMALRCVIAAGLVIDAVVHLRIAGDYDRVGVHITEGMLFRAESAVALFAAIFVLLSSRRLAALIAAVVAASAVVALLLSVYWDIGAIGPFPDLYEPIWFTEKIIAVVAEAVSALAAIVSMLVAVYGSSSVTAREERRVDRESRRRSPR